MEMKKSKYGNGRPFSATVQRHPSPAMNWFLVAVRKDVSNAVNAIKPHSSVQLSRSVGVKGMCKELIMMNVVTSN